MANVVLTGKLICKTDAEAALLRQHMPEHIRLSRAEPGCLLFECDHIPGTLTWQLNERFVDAAAFQAHKDRTDASVWRREAGMIRGEFTITESPAD